MTKATWGKPWTNRVHVYILPSQRRHENGSDKNTRYSTAFWVCVISCQRVTRVPHKCFVGFYRTVQNIGACSHVLAYIHVYTCACTCTCICKDGTKYRYMYERTYMYIHVHVHVHVRTCTYSQLLCGELWERKTRMATCQRIARVLQYYHKGANCTVKCTVRIRNGAWNIARMHSVYAHKLRQWLHRS